MPHTIEMFNSYNVPLGFMMSPLVILENEGAPMMEMSGEKIAQCRNCRSYMNCYNKIEKDKYSCFICYNEHQLPKEFNPKAPGHQ